jgi:hypothetical protein
MTKRPGHLLIWVLAAGFLLITGCAGTTTTIAVGDDPGYRQKGGPPHHKGGPPPWAPAHGYRAKHTYCYYPSHQIYFDVNRKLYFYFSNGEWRVSASLPVRYRIRLGDSVVLEMATDRPYHHHQEVVKKHPPKAKGKGKV